MGATKDRRRLGSLLISLFSSVVGCASGSAVAAAADPYGICARPVANAASRNNVTNDALSHLSADGESALAKPGGPRSSVERSALAARMVPGDVHGASPAAVSAYCDALGELVRRGWIETALPADQILHVAFLDAQAAGDAHLAALAAFRLSLALTAVTTDPESEAARGAQTTALTDSDLLAERSGAAACSLLESPDRDVRGAPSAPIPRRCGGSAALASSSRDDARSRRRLSVAGGRRSRAIHSLDGFRDQPCARGRPTTPKLVFNRSVQARLSREVVGRLIGAAIDAGVVDRGKLAAAA